MTHQPQLLDHNYDCIREYDNPTPAWWHLIFIATVLLSPAYVLYYHFNPDVPDIHARHQAAVAEANRRLFEQLGIEIRPDAATMLWLAEANGGRWMTVGRSMFVANCASCHGAGGQGTVGPNMTDDAYKNIAAIEDIPRVVSEGAAAGAMPAWRNRLSDSEIVLISAYVASLRGTDVPGRAPEGTVIPPWPEAPAAAPGEP